MKTEKTIEKKILHKGKYYIAPFDHELFNFLKKKRIVKKFLLNVKTYLIKENSFWLFAMNEYTIFKLDSITGAFLWSDTPEGIDFWTKLAIEYDELLRKK